MIPDGVSNHNGFLISTILPILTLIMITGLPSSNTPEQSTSGLLQVELPNKEVYVEKCSLFVSIN